MQRREDLASFQHVSSASANAQKEAFSKNKEREGDVQVPSDHSSLQTHLSSHIKEAFKFYSNAWESAWKLVPFWPLKSSKYFLQMFQDLSK